MGFNKQYKLAKLQIDNELVTQQRANAAATNHLANEQHETNKLLKETLEVKDRVDISRKEYEKLTYDSKLLSSVHSMLNNLLDKIGLTLEEFCSISKDDILVQYSDNPMDFKLCVDVRLKTFLSPMRVRELLNR